MKISPTHTIKSSNVTHQFWTGRKCRKGEEARRRKTARIRIHSEQYEQSKRRPKQWNLQLRRQCRGISAELID